MGLDQWLHKLDHEELNDEGEATCVEIKYWRKANQIHRFFHDRTGTLNNHQDYNCQKLPIPHQVLAELTHLCEGLLRRRDDVEAMEKLPPMEGFFFGGLAIDEYYWNDVEKTYEMLKAESVGDGFEGDYVYVTWW